MANALTIPDVSALLELMGKHGVVQLSYGGLTVVRAPDASGQAKPTPPSREDEFRALERMPPDSLDKALLLRRTKGGV